MECVKITDYPDRMSATDVVKFTIYKRNNKRSNYYGNS